MEYVVFGMGGVGASVYERLARAGLPVTGIARGAHLAAMRDHGLRVERLWREPVLVEDPHVCTAEECSATPDVVFVCVKGYSLESVYPLLRGVCTAKTIVIPLLNIYGTGERMEARLRDEMGPLAPVCADGCIYVSAELAGPGVLLEHAPICRVLFGLPSVRGEQDGRLAAIAAECSVNGIETVASTDIRRDALGKFSYVSPMGATAIIHDATAGDVQRAGAARDTFVAAVREVEAIGAAMGVVFDRDLAAANLAIADSLDPSTTTSMQRDLMAGRPSEFDGLVSEVVRLGVRYHVPTPTYLEATRVAHNRFGL